MIHGRELQPPFTVAALYSIVGADTVWTQLTVNTHPVGPTSLHPVYSHDDSARAEPYRALGRAAAAAHIPPGASPLARASAIAQSYETLTSLVDSARVRSPQVIDVYWRGDSRAHAFVLSDFQPTKPVFSSRHVIEEAWSLYLPRLSSGGAVLFGDGVMTVPRSRLRDLDTDIAAIKRGNTKRLGVIKDVNFVNDIRNPRPFAGGRE